MPGPSANFRSPRSQHGGLFGQLHQPWSRWRHHGHTGGVREVTHRELPAELPAACLNWFCSCAPFSFSGRTIPNHPIIPEHVQWCPVDRSTWGRSRANSPEARPQSSSAEFVDGFRGCDHGLTCETLPKVGHEAPSNFFSPVLTIQFFATRPKKSRTPTGHWNLSGTSGAEIFSARRDTSRYVLVLGDDV